MTDRHTTDTPPLFRLSAMMFMQVFVLGCTSPIITLYLKSDLGFSGLQIGWIMASTALSSIISPLIGACVADRCISAERLLAISHFGAAVLLYTLSFQTRFGAVIVCYLLYGLIIGSTTALTTAITFHHHPGARTTFGGIRLWGTLGWICAAWIFRFVFASNGGKDADLTGALLLGVLASLTLGIFSFFIPPAIGTKSNEPATLLPRDSLAVLFGPSLLVLCLFATVISIADRFYVFGGAPYLKSLGMRECDIMPALSVGQVPEVIGLALLGFLIVRFGTKKVFLLGAGLEIVRFLFFVSGVKGPLLYLAISLHGLTYAFFFVTASIFLDRNCTPQTRSGAHQYFSLIVSGTSTLAGNLLAGLVAELTQSLPGDIAFQYFWTVPLLFSIAGFAGMALLFRDRSAVNPSTTLSL